MKIVYVQLALCLIFSLYNNFTDWRSYCIKNRAVLLFGLLGIGFNCAYYGVSGLLSSLGGATVMLCLLPLFALRMLGAGDIKALMAVGCMLGWRLALPALLYSLLAAGGVALLVLLWRRSGRERLRHLLKYFQSCFLSRSLLSYRSGFDSDDSGIFRFSFGITLGLVLMLTVCWLGYF